MGMWTCGRWLARCVPQLAARATATTVTTVATDRQWRKKARHRRDRKKSKMRSAGSRATALATLVLVTRPNLLPACVQATPEAKKMRPPHAPTSSHRRPIERFLEQALTGGCWHPGKFMRYAYAYDQPGGSPVACRGRSTVCSDESNQSH